MQRSSLARMPSKPPGASSILSSISARPCIATEAGRGGPPKPMRLSPTATAGTTRDRRSTGVDSRSYPTMVAQRSCFLVGDIGATNARLAITALRDGNIVWIHEVRVADADVSSFDAAIDVLFAASPVGRKHIDAACLGVAGPIRDHRVRFTHRNWSIDPDVIAAGLAGAP